MIVTIDFETYYSQDYSLKKMSEVDYILDPRFEVILCAIKMGDQPTKVYSGNNVGPAIRAIQWEKHALLAHNVRFDGAILAWHYNMTPGIYLDTLSMARAITHIYTGSSSLQKIADFMGLPPKGTAVHDYKGMTLADFSPAQLLDYAEYCEHDTNLCRIIFDRYMAGEFPKGELHVIDLALRMFIEPQAKLSPDKLALELGRVRAEKAQAFAQLAHIEKDRFTSNAKFAALLQSYDVDVPMKKSPTTGQDTWALAKNDREFKELCANPENTPVVQAALACRLGAKSTIDETRAATLLNLSQRDWGSARGQSWMPVPYRYYGAHTGRFSGDGGYNFANLRRGSPLRDAIEAPAGYRVVHRDASQIEARLVAWLAGCKHLVEAFAKGQDVYCDFASRFYGRIITKSDKLERHTGKQAILSLGYGAGPVKFRHSLYIGTGGMSVELDEMQAETLVKFYRQEYNEIPELWWQAKKTLERMIELRKDHERGVPDKHQLVVDLLPVVEAGLDCVFLPNGMSLQYPKLHYEDENEMYFSGAYGKRKIYGAKLIENITQALARVIVIDIMVRVWAVTGHHPCMSTYDSHDYIVPEDLAEAFDKMLEYEFSVTPQWAPDLPLASEGGWGRTLLEAEKGANQ